MSLEKALEGKNLTLPPENYGDPRSSNDPSSPNDPEPSDDSNDPTKGPVTPETTKQPFEPGPYAPDQPKKFKKRYDTV